VFDVYHMGGKTRCSGARIVATLIHGLKRTGGKYGVAAIRKAGGGASALVVEVL
jgi:acetyl-CoA acetyltransferase